MAFFVCRCGRFKVDHESRSNARYPWLCPNCKYLAERRRNVIYIQSRKERFVNFVSRKVLGRGQ